ncbi:hypothetical protein BAE44_0000194 [Dichanthelium oligosanthes]|uniref:Uncharacterized protein n=1 Tax=Dichanthelium oligosanthes TaxID=888268 RepID=A0A1E5WN39_9POAL|nr:hypothetical protein BAE44_0000194 [Dichanthelium oligosanthes]
MASDDGTLMALFLLLSQRRACQLQDDEDDNAMAVHMAVEAEARQQRRRHGSVPGRIILDRDHTAGHARIMADYFNDNPVYTYYNFQRQ